MRSARLVPRTMCGVLRVAAHYGQCLVDAFVGVGAYVPSDPQRRTAVQRGRRAGGRGADRRGKNETPHGLGGRGVLGVDRGSGLGVGGVRCSCNDFFGVVRCGRDDFCQVGQLGRFDVGVQIAANVQGVVGQFAQAVGDVYGVVA